MKYRVELSSRARRDVNDICDWIGKRSPGGAGRWYERFAALIEELIDHGSSYPTASETNTFQRPLLQAVFRTRQGNRYRALFVIEEDLLRIITVRGPGQPPVEPDEIE